MKTLRVELADLEGIPHGSAPAGTRAEITAAYTGVVALTDGTLIPNAIKAKTVASSGVVDFSVYPSDSPDVREEYHGFGVTITAKIQSLNGTVVTARRTVIVPDSSPSTVHLGNLAPADPLPPQWVTVGDLVGDIEAAAGTAEWAGIPDKPESFPPSAHAANHATGGSDPITPESIGAANLYASSRAGSGENVDLYVDPGTYFFTVSAANLPEGSPGYLEVVRTPGLMILQRYTIAFGPTYGLQWTRASFDGSAWPQWNRVVRDDDPRLHDTGWRVLSSWGTDGVVTGGPLPNGVTPTAGTAGKIMWRRKGDEVTLRLLGLQLTGAVEIPIPPGFRPLANEYRVGKMHFHSGESCRALAGEYYVHLSGPAAVDGVYGSEFEFRTPNSRPNPLPGTPA